MPSFWLPKHEFLSPRNAQENGPKHDFLVPWLGEDIPKSDRLGKQLTVRVSLHRFEGISYSLPNGSKNFKPLVLARQGLRRGRGVMGQFAA